MLTETTGDLFDAQVDAYAHGCNCTGAMGAGIAVGFRQRWPDMYDAYRRKCLAGSFTLGSVFPWETTPWVYNLGTQPRPGPCASLDAIATSVATMLGHAEAHGVTTIGIPRIGAGYGGLRWSEVRTTLQAAAALSPVDLIVYTR